MTEFNLSEKRSLLKQKVENMDVDLNFIFSSIEEQDKEFIKLLIPDTLLLNKKFDSNTVMEVIRILRERQDKLCGEKLRE